MLNNRVLVKFVRTNTLKKSPSAPENGKASPFRKSLCSESLQGRSFIRKVNLSRWSFKKKLNESKLLYLVTCI